MAKRGNPAKRTSVQVLDYVSSKSYTNLTLAQYIENTKEAGNYQLRSMGDFFKPCPSRAKAGFKKSPSR
jgi:hypothetical protein